MVLLLIVVLLVVSAQVLVVVAAVSLSLGSSSASHRAIERCPQANLRELWSVVAWDG